MALSIITLNTIISNIKTLSMIMLITIHSAFNTIMLIVPFYCVMLSAIMMSVIMLSVIMLSVATLRKLVLFRSRST